MLSISQKRMLYGISTSILGFYRGVEHYKFNHKYELDKYKEKSYNSIEKPNFFYYKCFCCGIMGSFVYINPFILLVMIPKELYRLEVNLRNMEDEKKTTYYNEIF